MLHVTSARQPAARSSARAARGPRQTTGFPRSEARERCCPLTLPAARRCCAPPRRRTAAHRIPTEWPRVGGRAGGSHRPKEEVGLATRSVAVNSFGSMLSGSFGSKRLSTLSAIRPNRNSRRPSASVPAPNQGIRHPYFQEIPSSGRGTDLALPSRSVGGWTRIETCRRALSIFEHSRPASRARGSRSLLRRRGGKEGDQELMSGAFGYANRTWDVRWPPGALRQRFHHEGVHRRRDLAAG